MKKLLLVLCLIAVSCSKDESSNDSLNSYSPPELYFGHTQQEVIAALGEPDNSYTYEDNTRFNYISNKTGLKTVVYHFLGEEVFMIEVHFQGSQDNLNFIKEYLSSTNGTPQELNDFGELKVLGYPVSYPMTELYFIPDGSKIFIKYIDREIQ